MDRAKALHQNLPYSASASSRDSQLSAGVSKMHCREGSRCEEPLWMMVGGRGIPLLPSWLLLPVMQEFGIIFSQPESLEEPLQHLA